MDSWLDVVDENDNIIGKERFWRCHGKSGPHLPHRSSAVFIFKDSTFQEILITKRSEHVLGPNLWDAPAGHVEHGETYFDNIKKEVQEEVFHEHESPNLEFEELFKVKIPKSESFDFSTVFRIVHPGPFYNFEEEITAMKFIKIDDLIEEFKTIPEKYTFAFKYIVQHYVDNYNKKI